MKKYFLPITLLTLILIIVTIFYKQNNINERQNFFNDTLISMNVCPPFYLYDENDSLINPVLGINADKPYSPRKTCGKCHDYEKITKGYHFQQGRGEEPNELMKARYQWVTSPGNYGGTWCSPAPIYRQLAKKTNKSAKEIDMTSFDFITATCGGCHPGGGSLEFDRNGIRYDKFIKDSTNKLSSGDDNNFDGDYYKAKWDKTGVIEADCMLCHLPEYNFKVRNANLDSLNFKWMATAGSGLASVNGSIKSDIPPEVIYDITKFDKEGKLSLHLVREPRNETCLNCHSKPDWKKRGASYTSRTDVHIKAGLKCVDCHAAGRNAPNERIRGKEEHQFGKGDDPSGFVRDDLDNTVRDCKDCHLTGYRNAPIAKHNWLPPLHLEKLSCQTCHINVRGVKSALVQVSDVYNPGTKISPPPKYIWTFYDQNMKYWNHYGEFNMFTNKDQPNDIFYPLLAEYKGKIFPVNPVHSAWPGIYTEGQPGLNQPKMKDVYGMWIAHKNENKYPELKKIKDDNGDKVPEVNTEEEIDAFINSVREHLINSGYDLSGKEVVWVNNDIMYRSSKEFKTLDKKEFESSPYASVYKYSHDVSPSKSALGINGCTDCHSNDSKFFNAAIVKYPFGRDGKPVTEPQYKRMDISAFTVLIGFLREEYMKPLFYIGVYLFIISFLILLMVKYIPEEFKSLIPVTKYPFYVTLLISIMIIAVIILYLKTGLPEYMLPERFFLDANHFIISLINMLIGIITLVVLRNKSEDLFLQKIIITLLIVSAFSGFLMIIQFNAIFHFIRYTYTVFDLSQTALIFVTTFVLIKNLYLKQIKFKI